MYLQKLIALSVFIGTVSLLSGCKKIDASSAPKAAKVCPGENAQFSMEFFQIIVVKNLLKALIM